MKTNINAVAGIGLLVLCVLAFASIFEIHLASAQVDASSSIPLTTDTTTVPQVLGTSTSTEPTGNDASSTAASTPASETLNTTPTVMTTDAVVPDSVASASTSPQTDSTPATSTPATEPPPVGLTKVNIIGTKYVDYFTDGTTITSYPGDPAIDDNLNKTDAPIPTHGDLTWVHTTGGYLYDTPSGVLELGDYALQPNGSYIQNAPPFVSSTSTPAVSSPTDGAPAAPAVLGASTSTVPGTSNTSTPPGTSAATDTDLTESLSPDLPGSSSAASSAPATTTGN